MRRLLCFFGRHRHGRVREVSRRLRATCTGCGIGLVQDHMRRWLTLEEDARLEERRKARRARAIARQRPPMRP